MTMKCRKCGYEWEARVLKPKECPGCKSRGWSIKNRAKGLGLMLLVLALGVGAWGQGLEEQFPENPQPVKRSEFGGYQVDRTKLPKFEPVFTRTWVGAHVLYLGAVVFDAEATHQGLAHHKCHEANVDLGRRPSRGDLYRNNLLQEYLPLTAMDLLFQAVWRGDRSPKAFKWVPLIGAGYGSVVHIRGGAGWAGNCW